MTKKETKILLYVLVVFILSSGLSCDRDNGDGSGTVLIRGVPLLGNDGCLDCSGLSFAMVMKYYDNSVTREEICSAIGPSPGPIPGWIDWYYDLVEYVESRGFVVETHMYDFEILKAQIDNGYPIVVHQLWTLEEGCHARVVIGYDDTYVYCHDNNYTFTTTFTHEQFMQLWEGVKDRCEDPPGLNAWLIYPR